MIPPTPIGYKATRPTDDYYPPISARMGEEGAAAIRICVSAASELQGMPTLMASSGHRLLDAAAVKWAREALRFQAATLNGAAIASCKDFRVNFKLR